MHIANDKSMMVRLGGPERKIMRGMMPGTSCLNAPLTFAGIRRACSHALMKIRHPRACPALTSMALNALVPAFVVTASQVAGAVAGAGGSGFRCLGRDGRPVFH